MHLCAQRCDSLLVRTPLGGVALGFEFFVSQKSCLLRER
jgi:hypothetical protein